MPRGKTEPNTGEYPHKAHYDVRDASESYSNIAAVLAGFAFAAIVLVVQIPNLPKGAENFRDWATISFLVAFIGCLLSAFTFALVHGEEMLSPRSHTVALLGGCGFLVSANLVLWGIAAITRVYLSASVYSFIFYSFPVVMAFTPMYVAFSAFDPIIAFDRRHVVWTDYAQVFAPGYVLLTVVVLVKYMGATFPTSMIAVWFNRSCWGLCFSSL